MMAQWPRNYMRIGCSRLAISISSMKNIRTLCIPASTNENDETLQTIQFRGKDCPAISFDLNGLGMTNLPRRKGKAKIKVNLLDKEPIIYGITAVEQSTIYSKYFNEFQLFLTNPISHNAHGIQPISHNTAKSHIKHARLILGWCMKTFPINAKPKHIFKIIFPNSEKQSADYIFQYIHWLTEERNASPAYLKFILHTGIKIAVFLYHKEAPKYEGENLPLVEVLQKLIREQDKVMRSTPKNAQIERKWLGWDEYLKFVETMRRKCKYITKYKRRRAPIAIAQSFQRYLICGILACVPDRQRTLRELQVGKNLVKMLDGKYAGLWIIKHSSNEYKTGRYLGDRPPLVIDEELSPYLEEYLLKWRKAFKPNHNFVFSKKNGSGPLDAECLHSMFTTAVFNETGKCTNPHLVRDMVITHVRGTNASQRQLEALALYMGHSLGMQRQSYDRRTSAQKVGPAINLISSLHEKKL